MSESILTLNAGSSSIKFALFARPEPIPKTPDIVGQIDGIGARPHLKVKGRDGALLADEDLAGVAAGGGHGVALAALIEWLGGHDDASDVVAVGHRVVHGGTEFLAPKLIDPGVLARLKDFAPLAPLHQPHNVAGIEAVSAVLEGIPQVACFDTAFHRSQPDVSQVFALPRWITAEGVRRYGFHGLSYEYISEALSEVIGERAAGRIVVAHLGNGASACAIREGRSMASSMGFTAVDGLIMGTRCGSLDPGVLLYLMRQHGMDDQALERLMYRESGLLGVSGISFDMRELLASPAPEAAEAVDLFCHRLVREIGALAAVLGGIDTLVFTGGIGQHAAPIRERVCGQLAWLGLDFDPAANAANDLWISGESSEVDALVMATNEEWMIARHTARLLEM